VKTKNVYVYVYLAMEGNTWSPMTFSGMKKASVSHAADRRLGFRCSPIVKVAVPLPEVKK